VTVSGILFFRHTVDKEDNLAYLLLAFFAEAVSASALKNKSIKKRYA